MERIG